MDGVVSRGVNAVILQPGGNDRRKGSPDRTAEIQSRLSARGIAVIMVPNSALHGLPHQPDGQHLTPEGYHMLAESRHRKWPTRSVASPGFSAVISNLRAPAAGTFPPSSLFTSIGTAPGNRS